MEYSYHQEGQENRPNLETSRDHQQSQPAIHYQHPQYPPSHHALQPGYHHALGFSPYIHPLHTGGPALSQESRQGELPRPRVAPSETSSTVPGSRAAVQMGAHDYESVLGAGLHATVQTSIPHQLPSENATPDPSYQIQDLSSPSNHRVISSTSSVDSIQSSSWNPAADNSSGKSKTLSDCRRRGRVSRHRGRSSSSARESNPTVEQPTARQRDAPNIPLAFSRACQTDPLFEEQLGAVWPESAASDLPEGLCYGEVSDARTKSHGVFASKNLDEGKRFGPFTGEFVKEGLGCYNPSTWEICVQGRTRFYIDGSGDPGNWMNDVRVARYKEEQNLEAFQFYGSIFFRTTRSVEAGAELRVFYSEDYGRCVGFKSGLDGLHLDKDAERFECQDCSCRYANAKSLMRHIKFEHDKENTPFSVAAHRSNSQETSFAADVESGGNPQTRRVQGESGRERTQNRCKKQAPRILLHTIHLRSRDNGAGRRKAEPMKLFVCKKCGKQFPSEGRLKEHAAFHTETKSLKPICEICGLECKNKRSLKQHMLSHDSRSHQCHHCKKFFGLKKQLVYHLRHDHNETVGGSGKWIRGSVEDYLSRYVGPAEDSEETEPFHPELPKDMLGKRILAPAKKPKVFKCKYCPKKFAGRHDVVRHEKVMHTNSGRFKCEFCPANFMEERCLILHQQKHTKDRPYKCEECPLSFSSEKALENHQPEHRGERPFRCEICNRAYRTRKDMNAHKRRQHTTPSVLFNCSFCDKSFREKKSLERHEHRHKGIRPHVCLTCGKAFGAKYSLQRHALVHTGEKPFECKVCQKRFRHDHHLVGHMILHDQEKKMERRTDVVQDRVASSDPKEA